MKKSLKSIKWTAVVGDKEYGSVITINKSSGLSNQGIKETVDIIAEQITQSLQTIINKKSDRQIAFEKAMKGLPK